MTEPKEPSAVQPPAPPQQPPWVPPPGSWPYPYPPYPPPAAPINMYAILSLVFALFVLPPLGVYFGVRARREIERTGERGSELATAGIICGWIFTGLMGLVLLVWIGFAVFFFSTAVAVTN